MKHVPGKNPPRPPTQDLSERERLVLQALVREYVASARPVGSALLASRDFPNLSSATIRNVLATLETAGFLEQPHASAGRIPTDLGFRYFIDRLLTTQDLSTEEKQAVSRSCDETANPLESLRETSRLLSRLSNQVGLVTAPRLASTVFRQIQFVRISNDKILAIFVAAGNVIEQCVVRWENPPSQESLWQMARYLNELLEDLPLQEVRARIAQELEKEKTRHDAQVSSALKLQDLFLQQSQTPEIFVEGHAHLMQQPEFVGAEKLAGLFRTFEEKRTLLRILELAERAPSDASQIVLGEELKDEAFADLAFVTHAYGTRDQILGTLAVAGPRRMDYARIVPIVNFTAQTLSDLFSRPSHHDQTR